MLLDVKLSNDALMTLLGYNKPQKLEVGIYINCCYNFSNNLCVNQAYTYRDRQRPSLPGGLCEYGVCDSIEQWKVVYNFCLTDPDRSFAVGFTEVKRVDEPPTGGWRWHKWGPYIGIHVPEHEYLYDEKGIDSIFTFEVIELKR